MIVWIQREFNAGWREIERRIKRAFGSHELTGIIQTGPSGRIPTPPAWRPKATALTQLEEYTVDEAWNPVAIPAQLPPLPYIEGRASTLYRLTVSFGDANVDEDYLEPVYEAARRLIAFRYDNRGNTPDGAPTSAQAYERSGAAELVRHWKRLTI